MLVTSKLLCFIIVYKHKPLNLFVSNPSSQLLPCYLCLTVTNVWLCYQYLTLSPVPDCYQYQTVTSSWLDADCCQCLTVTSAWLKLVPDSITGDRLLPAAVSVTSVWMLPVVLDLEVIVKRDPTKLSKENVQLCFYHVPVCFKCDSVIVRSSRYCAYVNKKLI